MTDREAMQQALEALGRVMSHGSAVQEAKDILRERLAQPAPTIDKAAAIRIATALGWVPPGDTSQDRVDEAEKQRQEQEPVCAHDIPKIKCSFCHVEYKQPEQEPVAHLWQHSETGRTRIVMPDQIITADATWHVVGPLYLTPPRREWVGLTDEEMHDCWDSPLTPLGMKHVRMIEAKLKEKNT